MSRMLHQVKWLLLLLACLTLYGCREQDPAAVHSYCEILNEQVNRQCYDSGFYNVKECVFWAEKKHRDCEAQPKCRP